MKGGKYRKAGRLCLGSGQRNYKNKCRPSRRRFPATLFRRLSTWLFQPDFQLKNFYLPNLRRGCRKWISSARQTNPEGFLHPPPPSRKLRNRRNDNAGVLGAKGNSKRRDRDVRRQRGKSSAKHHGRYRS